jgi:exopolysaccharide production protein ExoZ
LKRFAYIDALRGYAILGVIVAHTVYNTPYPFLDQIASAGARGVQLFFVTSAIALMYAWHAHANGTRNFYIRRLFRIAPMLWLAIPLTYASNHMTSPEYAASWDQILAMLATTVFLHGALPQWLNSAVAGSWTIAVEATFYILFPLLVTYITTLPRALVAFCGSLMLAAAAWPILIYLAEAFGSTSVVAKNFAFMSFAMQAPCFLIGIATYFLIRKTETPRWSPTAAGIISLICIAALMAATKSVLPYIGFALAFGAAAYSLAHRPSLFVNTGMCWLGAISYSAYFWHFLVIRALAPLHLNSMVLLVATMAITCALSAVTYHFIERPMIAFGARLSQSSRLEEFSSREK